MALLARALAAALIAGGLAACYDPVLDDCKLTCTRPGDCSGGQVCGSDGYCAYPEVAGTCRGGRDAGSGGGSDGGAGPMATLRVSIERVGKVAVASLSFVCDTGADRDRVDCTVSVPRGAAIDLDAIATRNPFDHWTTANCAGTSTRCHLTITDDATVGARFH